MNETFKKIKIFLCGFGSAFASFLLFMLCREKLHDNRSAADGTERATEELRTTTDRLADANGRIKKLIAEIEATGEEK